jgi:hypothetical protein
MEKHHKLRRPAGSSIHACNICGIEGHQAANCTNGTVNWAQKWGPSAFASTGLGESTLPKEPDYKDLAAQAKAFAAKRLAEEEAAKKKAEGGGDDGDDGDDAEKDSKKGGEDDDSAKAKDGDGDGDGKKKRSREDGDGDGDGGKEAKGAKVEKAKEKDGGEGAKDGGEDEAKAAAAPAAPGAPGAAAPASDWRVFYDNLGRPYYHNSVTGVTQWTPPVV